LAPALKQTNDAVRQAIEEQYQESLGRAPDTAGIDYWFNQVASGSATLERALSAIAASSEAAENAAGGAANSIKDMADALRERDALDRQLLQAQGNTAALRQREIDALKEVEGWEEAGLVSTQKRIWAIQDEMAAAEKAAQVQQETIRQSLNLIDRIDRARESQLNAELSAIETLSSLYDSLQLSSQSILSPMERMNEAQRQFAALQVRAESGDTTAVGELQGASTAYLDTVAAYYGQSSEQYARVFRDVNDSVQDLEHQFEGSVSELESIGSILDRASRDALTSHRETMGSLGDLLDGMDWLPGALGTELQTLIDSMNNGTTTGGSSSGGGIAGGGSSSGGQSSSGGGSGGSMADHLGANTEPYEPVGSKEEAILKYLQASPKGEVTSSDFLDHMWELRLGNTVSPFGEGKLLQTYRNTMAKSDDSSLPAFATGAWSLPTDKLAMLHANEMVVPSREGIADEFRRYAAGDYQAELMAEISDIKRSLPVPNLPPISSGMDTSPAASTPAINLEPLTREFAALRLEVAQLRSERRNDAASAATQRGKQLREQQKTNRNTKTKVPTL
ncbi:DUF4214 domain-containing protein, partial [Halomonas llamarensis]